MNIEQLDMSRSASDDQAHAHDLQAIYRLWGYIESGEPTKVIPPAEELDIIMADKDHFVARDSARNVIGATGLLVIERCNMMKIDDIVVAPEHRRKGIARALATHALSFAARQNYQTITTTAVADSQPLFRSLGFETFEENSRGAAIMYLDTPQ